MVDGYGKLSDEQIKLSTEVTPVNDPLRTSFHSISAFGYNKVPHKEFEKPDINAGWAFDIDSDLNGVHYYSIEESFRDTFEYTRHTSSEEAPYTITGKPLVGELISDADGLTREDKFSIQENHNPNNGTATIDPKSGSWTYTPDELFTGNDNFLITITDDQGFQETRKVNLEIKPPVSISGELAGVGYEDTAVDKHSTYTVTGWIDFKGARGIRDAGRNWAGGFPYRGNATVRYNDQGVVWAYEAPKNYNGIEDSDIEIRSWGGQNFYYRIPIRILPTNDKGEFTGDLFGEGSVEGGTIRGDLSFSDAIDGDSNPNYQIKENGSKGTAEIDPETGSWTYEPETGGMDYFTVSVTDDDGHEEIEVVTLEIRDDNTYEGKSAPIAIEGNSPELQSISEDTYDSEGKTVEQLVSLNFHDQDNDQLFGIAITANSAKSEEEGSWQYRVATEEQWQNIQTDNLSDTNSIFLAPTTYIRFKPVSNFSGKPGELKTRIIDTSYQILPDQQSFANPIKNPFGIAGIGTFVDPEFADIDQDGDLDLLVGDDTGTLQYYENTGTVEQPEFAEAISLPFEGLTQYGNGQLFPRFVDIDFDGDFDAFLGSSDGETKVLRGGTNWETGGLQFKIPKNGVEDLQIQLNEGLEGAKRKHDFVDIDFDGDLDAFTGLSDGHIYFHRNSGSKDDPVFEEAIKDPFGIKKSVEAYGLITGNLKDGPSGGWRNSGATRGHSFKVKSVTDPEASVSIDESGRWEYLVSKSFDGSDTVNTVTFEYIDPMATAAHNEWILWEQPEYFLMKIGQARGMESLPRVCI